LGRVRKELETMERRKSKGMKNNRNNQRRRRRNWARKFRTQGVDRRR